MSPHLHIKLAKTYKIYTFIVLYNRWNDIGPEGGSKIVDGISKLT